MKVLFVTGILFLAFGLAFSESQENGDSNSKDETAIMDNWFKSGNYDNRVRPNIREGPIQINISMYVLDFIDFDHIKHEFTIQVYLRQNWQDSRLAYEADEGITSITLNSENSKKLWIPDTFIANERRSKWHDVTTANEFTRVSPDGHVIRSIRLTVTTSCPMSLQYFPFDTNVCSLEIESYGHTMKDYYYTWEIDKNGKPKIGSISNSGTMRLLGERASEVNLTLSTGTYSRISADFLFDRPARRYIRDVFMPTALLTFISFTTLTVGSPQFRVLLSIVCLLGLLQVRLISSELIPSTSIDTNTALHFYIGSAYFMVFLTILVNFVAYHILQRAPRFSPTVRCSDEEGTNECSPCDGTPDFSMRVLKVLYRICELMKYILPITYILFNFWYWLFLTIAASVDVGDDFILNEEYN